MQFNKLPFNIKLLDNSTTSIQGLFPVESLDIFTSDNQFSTKGIYSSTIFGEVGTHKRQTAFGFIDLQTEIMHPKIFKELTKLKGLYSDIMSGKAYVEWDAKLKDFKSSNVIDGHTGYSFFMDHFYEIIHATNDSNIRQLRIKLLDQSKDKCMYRYYQVIPAGLRDIEMNSQERPQEDEINPLYRKLIRSKNTISIHVRKMNDPILDTVRWSMQTAGNQIYDYLENIFSGKRGWFLDKVASRNVHGSTRNVITGMDPAPLRLGAVDAITTDHTKVGLMQYMKGTLDLTIHDIRKGPMMDVIELMPNMSYVVDTKTLKRKVINPSKFTIDNWGTEEGLEKLINGFEKTDYRHKPIMIDGNYACLIYRDKKHFRCFNDIDDLPPEFNKSNVNPLSWVEMFYISVYRSSNKVVGFNTRYPIADLGSTYPSKPFLETTIKSENLIPLGENWKPLENEIPAIHMPIAGLNFVDSCSVHTNKLPGLNADMDGDMTNLTFGLAKETIKEVEDYLNSKEAHLDQNGNLRYGINDNISKMVLETFTRGFNPKEGLAGFDDNLLDHYSLIGEINDNAHEAATSPLNKMDMPTEAMYKAGNYKKGHVTLHGLDISIENPKGSVRSGVDPNGVEWSVTMMHHYGYFKNSQGADKDHVDCYIGDHPTSQLVFVINQIDCDTYHFDEHKVMLGFNDKESAKKGYLKNYEDNWNGLGSITELTIDELKDKLKAKALKEPIVNDKTEIVTGSANTKISLEGFNKLIYDILDDKEVNPLKERIDKLKLESIVNKEFDFSNYENWHGHIKSRPDNIKMRCGGPSKCYSCQLEKIYHIGNNGIGLEDSKDSVKDKPTAVIIKESNKWIDSDLHAKMNGYKLNDIKEWSNSLYEELKDKLKAKGYNVHLMSPHEDINYPNETEVIVIHSVGNPKFITNQKTANLTGITIVELETKSPKIAGLSKLSKIATDKFGQMSLWLVTGVLPAIILESIRTNVIINKKHYELSEIDNNNLSRIKSVN